jgi:hypothetical protein
MLFDITATGQPSSVGWTPFGTEEGFLYLDRDGDRIIRDGAELFGDATPLSWTTEGPMRKDEHGNLFRYRSRLFVEFDGSHGAETRGVWDVCLAGAAKVICAAQRMHAPLRSRAMMNNRILAIAVAIVCGMSVQATTQKPIRVQELDVLTSPPPESVSGMVFEADGVVVVEYQGHSKLLERQVAGLDRPVLSTEYSFTVKEPLKWHSELPPVGREFRLALPGGEKEEEAQIWRVKVKDADALIPRHQYVLFVNWNQRTNTPYLPWGPASVYDISTGNVRALARHMTRHNSRPAAAFLESLRNAAKGQSRE